MLYYFIFCFFFQQKTAYELILGLVGSEIFIRDSLQRFGALRGRGWHARLQAALAETQAAPASGGALSLTFEVIYGHAVRAPPRHAVSSETAIQLGDMRAALRRRGQNPHGV